MTARMDNQRLITRSAEPLNLEMPFSQLTDFVTPTDQFYVRCHFPIPEIDAETWRLRVEGAVETPIELSLADLHELPRHTVPATMECAGNGRSFLQPKVKGVEWDLGAVGHSNWTGVLLRHVLARAGMKPTAREIVLEGADHGEIKDLPKPPGVIRYARSLPLSKAETDVLLAFEMNGAPL